MKLHVLKNPNSHTLAECREVDDKTPPPAAPWEEMTVEAFEAWRDSQLDAGWRPPVPTAPPRQQMTRVVLDRLTTEEAQALVAAESKTWQVRILVLKATAAGAIHEDDKDFPAAVELLDSLGVVAANRWEELLAP